MIHFVSDVFWGLNNIDNQSEWGGAGECLLCYYGEYEQLVTLFWYTIRIPLKYLAQTPGILYALDSLEMMERSYLKTNSFHKCLCRCSVLADERTNTNPSSLYLYRYIEFVERWIPLWKGPLFAEFCIFHFTSKKCWHIILK